MPGSIVILKIGLLTDHEPPGNAGRPFLDASLEKFNSRLVAGDRRAWIVTSPMPDPMKGLATNPRARPEGSRVFLYAR